MGVVLEYTARDIETLSVVNRKELPRLISARIIALINVIDSINELKILSNFIQDLITRKEEQKEKERLHEQTNIRFIN